MLWGLVAYPLQISEQGHSVLYFNVITTTTLVAVLYVIATCGSLFFSGFRDLRMLAWANLIGLLVVMEVSATPSPRSGAPTPPPSASSSTSSSATAASRASPASPSPIEEPTTTTYQLIPRPPLITKYVTGDKERLGVVVHNSKDSQPKFLRSRNYRR